VDSSAAQLQNVGDEFLETLGITPGTARMEVRVVEGKKPLLVNWSRSSPSLNEVRALVCGRKHSSCAKSTGADWEERFSRVHHLGRAGFFTSRKRTARSTPSFTRIRAFRRQSQGSMVCLGFSKTVERNGRRKLHRTGGQEKLGIPLPTRNSIIDSTGHGLCRTFRPMCSHMGGVVVGGADFTNPGWNPADQIHPGCPTK
jgi:hypothetical protein